MKLAMCVIGCGGYAKTVLNDIYDMTDEFDLYFASRDINKAREYNELYGGAGFFGSYEEAVQDQRVDAVYIFTPHNVHLDNAGLAARNSKHILVEKPIARNLDETREMIDLARDAGVKLMTAENYRFLPAVKRCKDIIEAGNIGNVRLIQIQAEGYSVPSAWRTSQEASGGGVFIDGGIHFVDIMMNLGGFPERLYAAKPPQVYKDIDVEDGIVVTAHLPGGALGLINFSRATAVKGQRQWINVTGSKGHLSFTPYSDEIIFETTEVQRTIRLPEARRGVRGMVREFRDSIIEDREPVMNGQEGLRDLAIVLGAYESAERGTEVSISDPV